MNFINIKDDGENFLFQNSLQIKSQYLLRVEKNEIIGVSLRIYLLNNCIMTQLNLMLMLATSLIMAKN